MAHTTARQIAIAYFLQYEGDQVEMRKALKARIPLDEKNIEKAKAIENEFVTCLDETYPESLKQSPLPISVIRIVKGDISLLGNAEAFIQEVKSHHPKDEQFAHKVMTDFYQKHSSRYVTTNRDMVVIKEGYDKELVLSLSLKPGKQTTGQTMYLATYLGEGTAYFFYIGDNAKVTKTQHLIINSNPNIEQYILPRSCLSYLNGCHNNDLIGMDGVYILNINDYLGEKAKAYKELKPRNNW